jgi:mRNA-degrading endonuclease YafQ of YafQ-DinJ toxin-antitoxin module
MILAFDNPKHERLVNDCEALSKRYNKKRGIYSASDILKALSVLQAANTLAEVPPSYRPHPLKGMYKGCFAVDVDKVHRIIFRPNHDGDPAFRMDNGVSKAFLY